MSSIICLSGKKRSGKNTAANYIAGAYLLRTQQIVDFSIDTNGLLHIRMIDSSPWITVNENEFSSFDFKHIKFYSFADPLKIFCMDVFGLTYEQCYGTEKQKNSLTNIQYKNLPQSHQSDLESTPECNEYLTARRVLQYFGTDVVRRMCADAWVNATISKIKRDNPKVAIITDARFPNEIIGIGQIGGKTIRLSRDVCENDPHASEKALDDFPLDQYSHIVDNQNVNVGEQNRLIQELLKELI